MHYKKIYGPSLRFLNVAMGLIYFGVISRITENASEFFILLAFGQIIGHMIPFGSNNHLANLEQSEVAWLSAMATRIAIAILVLVLINQTWIDALALSSLVFFERIMIAYAIKNNCLDGHYLRILIGRAVALTFIANLIGRFVESALIILILAEYLARIFLYRKLVGASRASFEWRNTGLACIATIATWWPMAVADSSTPPLDLFVARIIVMILGLGSVFYLTSEAIQYTKSHTSRFGLVRDRTQILVILLCLLGLMSLPFLTKYVPIDLIKSFMHDLTLEHYAAIFLVVVLWFFAWNGAKALVLHHTNSEIKLSLLMIIFSLFSSTLPIAVFWQAAIVGLSWHIGVMSFYRK